MLISAALSYNAVAQTSNPALNALIKKGILTEAEAKAALAETEAAQKKEATSPWVLPLGKDTKLRLGGFLQANGEFGNPGAFEGSFRNGTQTHDRFRLRRARINVSGEILKNFDFKLEGDFMQGDGLDSGRAGFSGTDLFANWNRIPEANIKVGQYKAPFGLEQLTSDTTLFVAERGLPTGALTPERQVGVQLWGKPLNSLGDDYKNMVEYAVGAFNGNGRNTVLNDDDHFMYVGRLSVTPFTGTLFEQPVKWRLGGNAMYNRYGEGTRIGPGGNLLLNSDGSLSGFSAPDDAAAWGWGVDQTLTIGPVDLIAEYLEQNIKPKHSDAFDPFVANGWYAQASYYFPGKKVQLVGRYERFNPGQGPDDNISSVVGGLNWYIKGDQLKLMFDYYHTWSDFRDANPQFGKETFDMGLVRLQVMF